MVDLKKKYLVEFAAICYLQDDFIKVVFKPNDADDLFICKFGIFNLEQIKKKADEIF